MPNVAVPNVAVPIPITGGHVEPGVSGAIDPAAPSALAEHRRWPDEPADRSTIAVGVDGLPGGWQALAWAADEAASAGARLLVCRVYPAGTAGAALPASPSAAQLALADPRLAEAVVALAARLGGDRLLLRTASGDPVHRLREIAGRVGMTVVGAGRHHPRPVPTVAAQVAGHGCGTVVAVRPAPRSAGPFAGQVVIGVDGPESAAAGEFGFAFAARHRFGVTAVHVGDGPAAEGGVWVDDGMLETHLCTPSAGLDLLDAAVEPWHHAHPEVPVRRAVLPGHPVRTLVTASQGARLLVVGDRGRATPVRLLLGSVSRAVLTGAGAPVAVVPAGPISGPGPRWGR